ncbi:MAG: cyclopropane-fatty-acyl-phospholipid synthase family protein [Gammaproteobacteria bacterium]|nr:cyclopropane-fatty-acyl-phospholipid synthase family protein [Gammaproteobacteria bacterium]
MPQQNQQQTETTQQVSLSDKNKLGVIAKAPTKPQRVTAFDRWLLRKMSALIGHPPFVASLWDGVEYMHQTELLPVGHLKFKDRGALYWLLMDPELHFGDLYSTGRLEVEGDLLQFLEIAYDFMGRNLPNNLFNKIVKAWMNRPRVNSLSGSKNNIHHHYDIGNKFYELWLDKEAIQYTCAYFPDPDMSIEDAQIAKLHHVCRKLQLKPGDTVVEAGCGWGGLARFMAKHYGVNVKAYNISHEQIVFARSKALQEGLADKVEYIEDDYRNIKGEFDVFVSVGMLEHVGNNRYKDLGKVVDRCLKPDGRGLVHSIGRNFSMPMNAWIEKRIFPGAYPPSIKEMMDIFEPFDFAIQDVENLRLHYSKTLEHWWQRYEENLDAIREDFDEAFVRAWRLYLVGSIAAFNMSELQLFQIVFTRARRNDLPWSRAHLYTQG